MLDKYKNNKIIIIGAGPAGLAAGLELARSGYKVVIFDKLDKVGGMSRSEKIDGGMFDIGPHRFFSKSDEVNKLWRSLIGKDFRKSPRLTRMYYKRKFFLYPVELKDALKNLGIFEGFLIGLSMLKVRLRSLFKKQPDNSFEDWVVNRFGRRLYHHFFKSYTEKLWGISTKQITAGWAAQRLKDISLVKVIKNLIFPDNKKKVKSWIKEFYYPKLGAGSMYQKMAAKIENLEGQINLNCEVSAISREGGKIQNITIVSNGQSSVHSLDYLISSMPVNKFIQLFNPQAPGKVVRAANNLKFRSMVYVAIAVTKENVFKDNWIYVHEPEVRMVRITKFKNFSSHMVDNKKLSILGIEYPCWEEDELWQDTDENIIDMVKRDMEKIELLNAQDIAECKVLRIPDTYPVYAFKHEENLDIIFNYLKQFKNFQSVGRNGIFRYNNMDHSILTGFYAARNIMGEKYDVLNINLDDEYHEEYKKK